MAVRLSRFLALCCYVYSLAEGPRAVAANVPAKPTVSIADGVVVGTATRVANQPSNTGLVNAYLGVPFAQSPPLRFAPPAAPAKWSKPLAAQKLPPACLQQFCDKERLYFNNPGLAPPTESEDCMYLNVFAPQDASPKNLKPVMFWIFGGNLQFGTASLGYYNGSSLAVNQDVVVVAANYRTNIFGFSSSPEIPVGQQNSGFLDQRFALQWVQDNIAAFGGDPSKVTIFGESAGGYSVKQLLANPPSPLPFHGAIMESQELLLLGSGEAQYNKVLANFNCSHAASPLDCIRKVPGTEIQYYVSNNTMMFPPVSHDGTHIANVLPSILSGKFADVPVMIGTNELEGSVFLDLFGLDADTLSLEGLLSDLGFNLSVLTGSLAAPYPSNISSDAFTLVSRIVTDLFFTCTTQTLSTAVQQAGRQPIWRYRFDGVFPNILAFPGAGAYHTTEIPELWGTYPYENQFGKATPDQVALSKYMQSVWANFAKNPSQGPGWPKLGSNFGKELSLLGNSKNSTGNYVVPLVEADYPCVLYDPVLILSNKAY